MSVQPLPRWDDAATAGMSEAQLLLYRSNLLGSDLRITNYGGGNTSAKIAEPDPLTGEQVEVLWVKGSGGDIGSMKMDGFATLYLDKLHALKRRYRGLAHEDEMVGLLPALHLQPEPARDQHRHAAALLHPAPPHRSHARRRADRDRRREERRASDHARSSAARSAGFRWQRPGFELGPALRGAVPGQPGA